MAAVFISVQLNEHFACLLTGGWTPDVLLNATKTWLAAAESTEGWKLIEATKLLKAAKKNPSLDRQQHHAIAEALLNMQLRLSDWAKNVQRFDFAVHVALNASKAVRDPAKMKLWCEPDLGDSLRLVCEPALAWAASTDPLLPKQAQMLHEICGFLCENMPSDDSMTIAAHQLWPRLHARPVSATTSLRSALIQIAETDSSAASVSSLRRELEQTTLPVLVAERDSIAQAVLSLANKFRTAKDLATDTTVAVDAFACAELIVDKLGTLSYAERVADLLLLLHKAVILLYKTCAAPEAISRLNARFRSSIAKAFDYAQQWNPDRVNSTHHAARGEIASLHLHGVWRVQQHVVASLGCDWFAAAYPSGFAGAKPGLYVAWLKCLKAARRFPEALQAIQIWLSLHTTRAALAGTLRQYEAENRIALLRVLPLNQRHRQQSLIVEAICDAARYRTGDPNTDPGVRALPRQFSQLHHLLAKLYLACGDWDAAIRQADFMIVAGRTESSNWAASTRRMVAWAHGAKGKAFEELHNWREALAAYDDSHRLDWRPYEVAKCAACALRLGYPDRAARVLVRDPPDGRLAILELLACWTAENANGDWRFRHAVIDALCRNPDAKHLPGLLSEGLDAAHSALREDLVNRLPDILPNYLCSHRLRGLALISIVLGYRDQLTSSKTREALKYLIKTTPVEGRPQFLGRCLAMLSERAILDERCAYGDEAATALDGKNKSRLRDLLVGENWVQQLPSGYSYLDSFSLAGRLNGSFRAWLGENQRLNILPAQGDCFLRAATWLALRSQLRALLKPNGPLEELYGECDQDYAANKGTVKWRIGESALTLEISLPEGCALTEVKVQTVNAALTKWLSSVPATVSCEFVWQSDGARFTMTISVSSSTRRHALAGIIEDQLMRAFAGEAIHREVFDQALSRFLATVALESQQSAMVEVLQFAFDFTAMRTRLWLVEEGNDDQSGLHPRQLLHHFKDEESLEMPTDPRLWVALMRRMHRYRPVAAPIIDLAEQTGEWCGEIGNDSAGEVSLTVTEDRVFPVQIEPELFGLVLSALVANARKAQQQARITDPITIKLALDSECKNASFSIENRYDGLPVASSVGSGLGLNAVERTLVMHGGTGPFESYGAEAKLYTARFTLPLAYFDADAEEIETENAD